MSAVTINNTDIPRTDECLGNWVRTNQYGSGERSIGPVSSRAECTQKVKSECPGFDLANVPRGSGNGCWCQKSRGAVLDPTQEGSGGYLTCRVVALPTPAEEV